MSETTDATVETTAVTEDVTQLSELVDAFKREVALPGGFAAAYPNVSDSDITKYLGDVFGECQLDGWFGAHRLDPDAMTVTPAISSAGKALVLIYSGMRWVRIELRNTKTSARYKAGPVEYETAQAATLLTQLLKDLTARRDELIAAAKAGRGASYVLDAVWGREAAYLSPVFAPLELPFRGGHL